MLYYKAFAGINRQLLFLLLYETRPVGSLIGGAIKSTACDAKLNLYGCLRRAGS